MTGPFGMHLLQTNVEECELLRFNIPFPLMQNTIITIAAETHRNENGQFTVDLWGECPQSASARQRILLSSSTVPSPDESIKDHHEYVSNLVNTIAQTPAFNDSITRMFVMFIEQLGKECNAGGEDTF